MKYILIIFLFLACAPNHNESDKGNISFGKDSTAVSFSPIRVAPTIDSGFIGISFLRLRVFDDGSYLNWHEDGKITIGGDTIKLIRNLLESMKRAQEREMKLYERLQSLQPSGGGYGALTDNTDGGFYDSAGRVWVRVYPGANRRLLEDVMMEDHERRMTVKVVGVKGFWRDSGMTCITGVDADGCTVYGTIDHPLTNHRDDCPNKPRK
jgi:hypothetical protein